MPAPDVAGLMAAADASRSYIADAYAPQRSPPIARGRDILLVDDVMTAGATFSAAADTCLAHGAASVRVVALARVTRPE